MASARNPLAPAVARGRRNHYSGHAAEDRLLARIGALSVDSEGGTGVDGLDREGYFAISAKERTAFPGWILKFLDEARVHRHAKVEGDSRTYNRVPLLLVVQGTGVIGKRRAIAVMDMDDWEKGDWVPKSTA